VARDPHALTTTHFFDHVREILAHLRNRNWQALHAWTFSKLNASQRG
jgi:hypothetical protein